MGKVIHLPSLGDGPGFDLELDENGEMAWQRHERQHRRDQVRTDVRKTRRMVAAKAVVDWAHLRDPKFIEHTKFGGPFVEAARKWSRARGSALWLGETGVGKSLCMFALANRLLDLAERDETPDDACAFATGLVYFTADELIRAHRMHGLGRGECDEIREAVAASLLFLDEIGSEGPDHDGTLFSVVDRRYRLGRPTIAASGLAREKLSGRYGDAIIRRILDTGELVSTLKEGGK